MKKVVLKVEVHDDKIKKKAMKAVSGHSGVESVSMDMKDKKLTLTGDIDPVKIVAKLRKFCHTEMVSVGPAKEEKKEEPKKTDDNKENVIYPLNIWETYPNTYYYTPNYHTLRVEEDPNSCVIV